MSIKNFFLTITFLSLLFLPMAEAIDFNNIKSISEKSMDKNDGFLKKLHKRAVANIAKNIIQTLNLVKMDKDYKIELEKGLEENFKKEKKIYIFLLTSKSVPKSLVVNFIKGIDILNHNGDDIRGRIVFNGREKNKPFVAIMDDFNVTNAMNTEATINPFLFYDLNVTKVPAYVISRCPDDFKSLECVHDFMVKGEISFEKFLSILHTKNTKYANLYFDLVKPE